MEKRRKKDCEKSLLWKVADHCISESFVIKGFVFILTIYDFSAIFTAAYDENVSRIFFTK